MCDECGKTFKTETTLKKHKSKEHDQVLTRKYTCTCYEMKYSVLAREN